MTTPEPAGQRPTASDTEAVLNANIVASSVRVRTFVDLACAYFATHRDITHEWRLIPSRAWGDRIDLVCAVGTPAEVFATLRPHQIVVGRTHGHHEDFENFGRGLSDAEIAREAFECFVEELEDRDNVAAPQ